MNYPSPMTQIYQRPIFDVEWKSPWRLELEKYLAAEALKPKHPRVTGRPNGRPRKHIGRKEGQRSWRAQRVENGICLRCPYRTEDGHVLCQACLKSHRESAAAKNPPRPHCACGKILNRTNRHMLCRTCYSLQRRTIEHGPQPVCSECGRPRKRNGKTGLCTLHSKRQSNRAYKKRIRVLISGVTR